MTKRERFLKAMRNEPVDGLVWAPNFDYWLGVNTAEGTLPEQYRGMSRNDIVRAVGGTIWNRAGGIRGVVDPSVKTTHTKDGDADVYVTETPVGAIREVYLPTEGKHRSKFLAEHGVKDLDSLRVRQYIAEATSYEACYERPRQALADTGDDGVVLDGCFCVPFIQFAKTDAGYMAAFYMWTDHRNEVDALLDVYTAKYLEACRIMADGPADAVICGDNMDGVVISPAIFDEYALPFYRAVAEILAPKGKIFEAHWCGRTDTLLGRLPGSGLDIVEAVVTKPMAGVSLSEAIGLLDGKVVLQGGIPAVLVCNEGCDRAAFEQYVSETILPLKGTKGFILGMSDNVPPNADFARVEAITDLIS